MMKILLGRVATLIYFFAGILLGSMALLIMGWSVYEVYHHIIVGDDLEKEYIPVMLQSVGSIIIAIAILDVAKYMIEEEVYREKELRSMKEARETLTKIMVIVSIAVSIEGLIYIFKAGQKDITLLLYPAFLVIAPVFLIVGLGLFQRLSLDTEDSADK